MTKEEILEKQAGERIFDNLMGKDEKAVIGKTLSAMDEYARQKSIEFVSWVDGGGWECTLHDDENVKHWQKYREGKPLTTEQLYNLFEESQSKQ